MPESIWAEMPILRSFARSMDLVPLQSAGARLQARNAGPRADIRPTAASHYISIGLDPHSHLEVRQKRRPPTLATGDFPPRSALRRWPHPQEMDTSPNGARPQQLLLQKAEMVGQPRIIAEIRQACQEEVTADDPWAGHPDAVCSTLAQRASDGNSLVLPRLRFAPSVWPRIIRVSISNPALILKCRSFLAVLERSHHREAPPIVEERLDGEYAATQAALANPSVGHAMRE